MAESENETGGSNEAAISTDQEHDVMDKETIRTDKEITRTEEGSAMVI